MPAKQAWPNLALGSGSARIGILSRIRRAAYLLADMSLALHMPGWTPGAILLRRPVCASGKGWAPAGRIGADGYGEHRVFLGEIVEIAADDMVGPDGA
jgi:hypothetical protein